MAMVAAYWHKNGLDLYRFADQKPIKYASGSLGEIKPIKGILGKRVLIIGRELLLHVRKRYPPATKEKLHKAVGLEIGDIFPFSKPAFHLRVYESTQAHTTVDIWGWESDGYARLRGVFPYNYIVPEDLAYSSEIPEVKIFRHRELTNILAHSGDRFLGGASYSDSVLNEKDVERFIASLGKYRGDIKRIKVYGAVPFNLKDLGIAEITRVPETSYSPCLDYLNGLNLKEFKVRESYRLSSKISLVPRLLIYLIIGYGAALYFTGKNYDQAILEIRQKTNLIGAQGSSKDVGQKVEDYSEIVREVNERLAARPSPLKVMDMIAGKLPPESFVIRMVLNENNLEVTASSKDPISAVKALGEAEGIKTARLKGVPSMDMATRFYSFVISMELSR